MRPIHFILKTSEKHFEFSRRVFEIPRGIFEVLQSPSGILSQGFKLYSCIFELDL